MTSILCLAHYCDLHGPTPLMVTEGTPVPCNVCYDDQLHGRTGSGSDRPRSGVPTTGESAQATTAITDAFRRMNFAGPQQRSSSVPATELEAQTQRAALRRSGQVASAAAAGSAIETPPQSPRLAPGSNAPQHKSRQDSGFRKTYDDYVTRRAGPCDNCALTLPKLQPGSRNIGVESRPERGPTLRSKAPCALVYGAPSNSSPPTSQSSSSVASEDESNNNKPRPLHRRTATAVSVTSRSSESSSVANLNVHNHYLEYISTHEPLAAASFSIVRASCLRTLSLETLPRPPTTSQVSPMSAMSTPCTSPSTPAFVTTHSAGNAASGGPIFFGDPSTGYTTAYIFRIPDMHARGHKRVYAFLALSTHRERLAMKTFGFITKAFQDMATWIQQLAEAEAERIQAETTGSNGSSPIMPGPGYGSFPDPAAPPVSLAGAAAQSASSFLMGGAMGGGLSRRMGAGFGSSAVTLKQRGLAELVGLPDFFIELHARFVKLLLELGIVMGA